MCVYFSDPDCWGKTGVRRLIVVNLTKAVKERLWLQAKVILRWYVPQNIPKSLFKDGEERSIASDCTHEEKINFEDFTENGCYDNQPQSSCSFTKQDLTVNQAYHVSFCFVRCNEPKLWQYFLQAFFGNNLILYHTHWINDRQQQTTTTP